MAMAVIQARIEFMLGQSQGVGKVPLEQAIPKMSRGQPGNDSMEARFYQPMRHPLSYSAVTRLGRA